MRSGARRLMWFVPSLLVISMVAFAALVHGLRLENRSALPLFVNTLPTQLADVAWSEAVAIGEQRPGAESATHNVVNIGTAALPHVLPRLDELSPLQRRRVALSLAPIAERMGVTHPKPGEGGDVALSFWKTFWGDHAIDVQPTIIRRVVRRFAEHPTALRRQELRQLDTLALPELLSQLTQADDPEVLLRLAEEASHITGHSPNASVDAPNSLAALQSAWRSWWRSHRRTYVQPTGFERLLSPLLQTRYAEWIAEAVRTRFGAFASGETRLSVLWAAGRVSATLLFCFLAGVATAHFRKKRTPRQWRHALVPAAVAFITAPIVAYPYLAQLEDARLKLLAAGSWLFVFALLQTWMQLAATPTFTQSQLQSFYGIGLDDNDLRWLLLRPRAVIHLTALGARVGGVLSALMVVELGLNLQGIGNVTALALRTNDLMWMMLVTLVAVLLGVLFHLVRDYLLARWDTRLSPYAARPLRPVRWSP